jgi:hypothetical protein
MSRRRTRPPALSHSAVRLRDCPARAQLTSPLAGEILVSLGAVHRISRCTLRRYSSPIPEMPVQMSNASIVRSGGHDYANAPIRSHCRARCERPGHRRAAEQTDEAAPRRHSITSSASASSLSGSCSPSAFAALRLMTRSNLVGCTTGKSAGFSPSSTRPT